MDYCSCFNSNLIVFLLTVIIGFVSTIYFVYHHRDSILERIKTSVLSLLREVSYGTSDIIIASLWPIVAGNPLVIECKVTINATNQVPVTHTHWIRYDPQVATECNKRRVKLYALTNSGERVSVAYTPGFDIGVYAHEIDSNYRKFVISINDEDTTLDSEETISWRSILRLDEEHI